MQRAGHHDRWLGRGRLGGRVVGCRVWQAVREPMPHGDLPWWAWPACAASGLC